MRSVPPKTIKLYTGAFRRAWEGELEATRDIPTKIQKQWDMVLGGLHLFEEMKIVAADREDLGPLFQLQHSPSCE